MWPNTHWSTLLWPPLYYTNDHLHCTCSTPNWKPCTHNNVYITCRCFIKTSRLIRIWLGAWGCWTPKPTLCPGSYPGHTMTYAWPTRPGHRLVFAVGHFEKKGWTPLSLRSTSLGQLLHRPSGYWGAACERCREGVRSHVQSMEPCWVVYAISYGYRFNQEVRWFSIWKSLLNSSRGRCDIKSSKKSKRCFAYMFPLSCGDFSIIAFLFLYLCPGLDPPPQVG